VYGTDDMLGGTVSDVWVDRSEPQIRYLEVETRGDSPRRVLVPIVFCSIDRLRRDVVVDAITGEQFGAVPTTANPDLVSLREEDQISAYYGGGTLYATPERLGPIL